MKWQMKGTITALLLIVKLLGARNITKMWNLNLFPNNVIGKERKERTKANDFYSD